MFTSTVDIYDAIYRAMGKDYAAESAQVAEVVRQRIPAARSLLDVACGTGAHLDYLSRTFEHAAGVDLDPKFVRIASRRCPSADVRVADMRDLDLGEQFDAVVCLFSSIGYVRDQAGLHAAIRSMAAHLCPGGVLLVEPSFLPTDWRTGYLSLVSVDEPDLKVSRISRSGRDGDIALLDFDYLVGDPVGVRHIEERHELGLFEFDDYLAACRAVGLTAEIDEHGLTGRGLIVAAAPRA